MRRVALVTALVLLAGCGGGGAPGKAKVKPPPKRFEGAPPVVPTLTRNLRAALVARDFERLESLLAEVQARWKADRRTEVDVRDAYDAFDVPDEALGPHLDAWVASRPSAPAHTARGHYLTDMAFAARGTKFAAETSEASLDRYGELNALARTDFERALQLDPECIAALWGLMSMEGSRSTRERLFQQTLELDPASLLLRTSYLWFLQPKWGGSLEEIDEVVQDAQAHVAANPRLAALRGYRVFLEADEARREGDLDTAEKLLTKALESGEMALYYRERASIRVSASRFKDAVLDCDRGLAMSSEDAEMLETRGQSYVHLGMVERAMPDLDAALEIDPTLSIARYYRVQVRCLRKEYAAALVDAELVTLHNPALVEGFSKTGYLLIKLDRPADAMRYLLEAERMASGDHALYVRAYLASARYATRDEAALDDLRTFVQLAGPRPRVVHRRFFDWATKVLAASPEERWSLGASNPI